MSRFKHGDGAYLGLITGKFNVGSMCSHQPEKWIIKIVTDL